MTYNGLDIYACSFFALNRKGKLEFTKGTFRGRSIDDFNSVKDIQRGIAYCFWILNKDDNALINKYVASAFIKELLPKIIELEKRLKKRVVKQQKDLEVATEKSTKTIGTVYGK